MLNTLYMIDTKLVLHEILFKQHDRPFVIGAPIVTRARGEGLGDPVGHTWAAVLKNVIHIRAVLNLYFRALSRAHGVARSRSTRVSRATRVRARGRDNVRPKRSGRKPWRFWGMSTRCREFDTDGGDTRVDGANDCA